MPRITVQDKEFVLCFQHGTRPNSNYKGRRTRSHVADEVEYTKCVVLVGNLGCRDENKQVLGESVVSRYYKDTPNRVNARRTALDEVLLASNLTAQERNAISALIR